MRLSRIVLAIIAVFMVFVIVPFPFYAGMSAITGIEPPDPSSPGVFFVSVLFQKVGHASAFVLIFALARDILSRSWLVYAGCWWIKFVFDEVGLAMREELLWPEALAGIAAEAVYFPLGALIAMRLVAKRAAGSPVGPPANQD